MLKPEYYNDNEKIERILEIYRKLENFILTDISRRLLKAGEMTGTADRLIWKLQQMGESKEEIMQKLQEITKLSRAELKALLQDAVLTSWSDEQPIYEQMGISVKSPLENAVVMQVMDAQYKKSLGELSNLTRTTMNQSQMDLINMLDEADMQVALAGRSYTAAICDILDRYAGKGIYVDYPSGTRRTLEAAVRCAVVTSAAQMAGQISAKYVAEGGIEYVVTSAHLGARVAQKGQPPCADHSAWQGKIFKIEGSEPNYPNLLESTGYDIDRKNGVGKVVNPLGLYGYNCTHAWDPIGKDMRNPWRDENGNLVDGDGNRIDSEENRKRYELQQKQRYMERSIRATKRKLIEKQEQISLVAETDVKEILQRDYDKLAHRMTHQNKAYNDFCKANDLQPQYDRIKVADFGREQTKRSNAGAKKYKDSLNLEQNKNIIKERISNGEYSLSLSKQQYLKHVDGTKQYFDYQRTRIEKGNSPQGKLLVSEEEAIEFIQKYSGTGIPKMDKKGIVSNIEFVSSENIIGQYYKDGKWIDTRRSAIHHGKKGSHIVPVEEMHND